MRSRLLPEKSEKNHVRKRDSTVPFVAMHTAAATRRSRAVFFYFPVDFQKEVEAEISRRLQKPRERVKLYNCTAS